MLAHLLYLFAASSAGDIPVADCDERYDIDMRMVSSSLDARTKTFYGVFEISNKSRASSFEYGIYPHGKYGHVAYPEAEVEFESGSGLWEQTLGLPGSFMCPPAKVRLEPGEKAFVHAQLFGVETATHNARAFRLMVRGSDHRSCVRSAPFEGLPRRPRVERLINVAPSGAP